MFATTMVGRTPPIVGACIEGSSSMARGHKQGASLRQQMREVLKRVASDPKASPTSRGAAARAILEDLRDEAASGAPTVAVGQVNEMSLEDIDAELNQLKQ